MHPELHFIYDIAVIFALSAVALFFCHKLRIPTILGFLFAGIAAGPGGFGIIGSAETVTILAELGVIFLLFSIGVEFSFEHLLRIKKAILLGGTLQVSATTGAVFVICMVSGISWETSLVIGFLAALSSTAIVLKMLQDNGEMGTPQGRTMLAFLIFQDVIVIPMMLVIPWLGEHGLTLDMASLLLSLGKGVGMVVLVVLTAKYVVPRLLKLVIGTRSKELFLLVIVVVCFATAWATASLGLSLALGAFVAGLVISESEFSHHALGNVIPFRDIFLSFFFVSVGMLLDLETVFSSPMKILGITAIVLILKMMIASGATLVLRQPLRTAIISGMGLSQIGEFSFILASVAIATNTLPMEFYQLFLSVAILTIALTPFLYRFAPAVANAALAKLPSQHNATIEKDESESNDHLVIIGFGLNGQNLARAAQRYGIEYRILEMNNDTVREFQKQGEPIIFGDATQKTVLHTLGVERARTVVIAISDAAATRRIVELVREIAPVVKIITRTRFISEVRPLVELGANEVIPEEFETAIELFTRVLQHYNVPMNDIRSSVSEMRKEHYQVFRSDERSAPDEIANLLECVQIETVRIGKQHQCSGKTLSKLDLRRQFNVTVLGVHRDGNLSPNPGAEFVIQGADILVLMGEHAHISAAGDFLLSPTEQSI
jgi:K+:H+ antiporter